MSIRNLELKNFKRFRSALFSFDSPITLIYGPNSSGKSSIIKALLGIKQTMSENNEHEVFSAQGDYVDLGSYSDYIYAHKVSNNFQIKTKHQIGSDDQRSWLFNGRAISEIVFELKYSFDAAIESARLEGLSATLFHDHDVVGTIRVEKKRTRDSYWVSGDEGLANLLMKKLSFNLEQAEQANIFVQDIVNNSSVVHLEKFRFRQSQEHEFGNHGIKTYVLEQVVSYISRDFNENLFYLGPLRHTPNRSYIRSSHNINVGPLGEHTSSVFANIEARQKKVTRGTNRYKDASEQIAEWVNVVFPGAVATAETYKELVKLYLNKSSSVNQYHSDVISDVGFGFSQVFPILVQLAIMPKGSTLIVEQPELHLHPKAQVALAYVFSNAARQGKRLIIESHSEHLLRGIQVQISRERLKQKDKMEDFANVLYVPEPPKGHFDIEFNEYGELLNEWPKGFFDETYALSMEVLKNKGK